MVSKRLIQNLIDNGINTKNVNNITIILFAGIAIAFNGSMTLKLNNRMSTSTGSSSPQNVIFNTVATTWQGGAVTW